MADDPIIEAAQQAANTPADGPPHEREVARQENEQRHQQPAPTYEAAKKAAATRFEANQKERAQVAAQAKSAAAETVSPAEKKIAELRKHPAFYDKNHADNAKIMAEYRKALAEGDTPEERQALVASGVKGARELYGLDVPSDIAAFGKDAVAAYDEQFSQHEADLLLRARDEGWDKSLASDLRDYGVRLGLVIGDRGTPMTAEEVKAFKAKFKGRLTEAQQDQLVKWYQQSVVGAS